MKATANDSESTIHWPPAASPGGVIGVLGIILSVFLGALFLLVLTGPISLPIPHIIVAIFLILFVIIGFVFAFLLYSFVTIRYDLSPEQLVIRWGRQRHIVPLNAIQQILPAVERLGTDPGGWQKFWAGYYVGSQPSLSGLVTVVATLKVRRQLLIVTRDRQFAISPERPVLFLEAYAHLRRALDAERPEGGATLQPDELTARFADAGWTTQYPAITRASSNPGAPVSPDSPMIFPSSAVAAKERRRTPTARSRPRLLSDTLAIGLTATALLLNIVIVLLIALRYQSLPSTLALHWNASGVPDRVGSTRQIWIVPVITWLVTIGNLALAWAVDAIDRFASRFLLFATLMVDLLALIALYMLMR